MSGNGVLPGAARTVVPGRSTQRGSGSPYDNGSDSESSDDEELDHFGEEDVPDEHSQEEGSSDAEESSDSTEVICAASRRASRRKSSVRTVLDEASRTSFMQHLQACFSVFLGTHVDVGEDEEENNLTNAAKKLLGPLGRVRFVGQAQEEIKKLQSTGIQYQRMHHTFWSNFALSFWLGFWIALIGLPNYALTARKLIYGDTEQTQKLLQAREIEWGHYWCDLSDSGLSKADLLNITDCSTSNELEQADFSSQGFLNDSSVNSDGKVCGYRPGRRYFGYFKRFWIGSAAGNYFPTIDDNKPIYLPENSNATGATSGATAILDDGGSMCLRMCEASPNCTVWSWHSYSNDRIFGGVCHYYDHNAVIDTRLTLDWQKWIGGTCRSHAKTFYFCPDNIYGRLHNYAPITEEPDLRPQYGIHSDGFNELWCGILPEKWSQTWPNVVQMIVFTVFGGTGTTLQLAWQGFIGTTSACFNCFIMSLLFPKGGKGHICTAAEIAEEVCKSGEWIYNSPGYRSWIGFADTLGVLFLFMLSNSQINTIKFGMSWHFFFMMDFIDPDTGRTPCPHYDKVFFGLICLSEYWFVVLVTTILGCIFAVIVTFVPCPLFNQRKAYAEMATMAKTMSSIWRESVDYICGSEPSVQRFRIEAKIEAIREMEMTIESNLKAAWWENALLCRHDPRRQELLVIQQNLQDIFDVLPAVKWCVLQEDFQGQHQELIGDLQPHLQALVMESMELLELCIRAPYASRKDRKSMNRFIKESALHVHRLQKFLVKEYRRKKLRPNADLADETTLVFSLSFTARKAADLSTLICEEKEPWACWRGDNFILLMKGCWEGFKNTWNPAKICSRAHLEFALRNFIGISVAFWLSVTLQNYIFKKYSAVMPATLALLISQYQSTAFTNNLHRLLGVLLGKVLPLLILSGLSIMGCGNLRSVAAFACIWTYVTFFSYMYFTSQTWSLVGCLVAGFGVYPLMEPCITASLSGDILETRYSELGQITMAVAVQMLVDTVLMRHSPAEVAVAEMEMLLDRIFLGYDGKSSGLQAILENNLPDLQNALREAEMCLARAKQLSAEADPKQRIMAGPHTPFRIEFYRSALDILQGCMTCLNLVIMSEKTWIVNASVRDVDEEEEEEAEGNPRTPHSGTPIAYSSAENHSVLQIATQTMSSIIAKVEVDIVYSAEQVSKALQAILRHRIEAKLDHPSVNELNNMKLLDQYFNQDRMDKWLTQVGIETQHIRTDRHELTNNLQARLVVGTRAIAQLHNRLAQLHSLCLKANVV